MQKPEEIMLRLDWTVIRRLDGLLQGDYRTLFQGFGLELAGLREYQFNDDIRHIDWNVTARMQTPYIRQYMEDREITAWFLIDLSPSFNYGTTNELKRSVSIDFATVLARLIARHGNRIAAIIYDGKNCTLIPAKGGKIQVLRLIKELIEQPILSRTPATDLSQIFEIAIRNIKRRSLVFVVSDFISLPGWEGALRQLTHRHEVLAVRIYDPSEFEIPDIGTIIMEDSETGEQMIVDTHNKDFRNRFKEIALTHKYELEKTFQRSQVDMLSLATDDDMVKEILRFASTRKQKKNSPSSFKRTYSLSNIK